MEEEAASVERRRPRWRVVLLGLLGLLLLAVLGLWLARKPIASDYIDRELARRGVHATYSVKHLGFRTQRLENLVIGDPKSPDLTARWVELRLRWGFFRPKVSLITARGVRLNGRLVNGRIRLGEIEKLLPPPSGLPFRFPDQAVDIAQSTVRLDTPAGRIGLAVEGKGNLADGFRGRMAARSKALDFGRCRIDAPAASWNVAIDRLRPRVTGPASLASLTCGRDLEVNRARLQLDARLEPALDAWRGTGQIAADAFRGGKSSASAPGARFTFAGNIAETKGRVDVSAARGVIPGFTTGRSSVGGVYSLSLKTGRVALSGDAMSAGIAARPGMTVSLVAALGSAGGTPVEAIGDAWAAAVARAARAFDARGTLHLAVGDGKGGVRVDGLGIRARSGARLDLAAGEGFAITWPRGGTRINGRFALSGGGLPTARFDLAQARPGGAISGVGHVEPYAIGNSRLALDTLRFTAAPGGVTRIDTVARIDGPFDNGRIAGLVLPLEGRLDGRGGFVFDSACTPVRFASVQTGAVRLGPSRLSLCPTGPGLLWKRGGGRVQGGATIPSPRLAGTIGRSPLSVAGQSLRWGLDGPNFTGSALAIRLGPPDAVTRLNIQTLSGRFGRGGVFGTFAGLDGKLANVPLLLSQGRGPWSLAGGKLAASGSLRVADERAPPRFYPLVTNDFSLALAGNRITATGWLKDPDTGTAIARADILHSLGSGEGRALLDVPGIRFDASYQPEQLTPLTTGVIALVNGTLSGDARIGWGPGGSTSTGTFTTKGMNLAATFGPVENLSTTIHFTDLLNLATAPGQLAEVGLIRTGIDVLDGRIRYQLLPGLRVKVEGGRWPFAGGELALEETVLDFSRPSAKRLTFRVTGMDAARFVQQMEFSNISVTGTFDGVIPMIFDEKGGRIVGGHLTARPEGGTLSYIGELTDKQLGAYGKLAFDALKSLRYSKLTVNLDGSLDGEFLAGIQLDGVARDPSIAAVPGGGIKGMIANRALTQLAKIPFKFRIMVRGPFRAVIGTARSLQDPTNLLQSVLPRMLKDQPTTTKTVQPQESESVR